MYEDELPTRFPFQPPPQNMPYFHKSLNSTHRLLQCINVIIFLNSIWKTENSNMLYDAHSTEEVSEPYTARVLWVSVRTSYVYLAEIVFHLSVHYFHWRWKWSRLCQITPYMVIIGFYPICFDLLFAPEIFNLCVPPSTHRQTISLMLLFPNRCHAHTSHKHIFELHK